MYLHLVILINTQIRLWFMTHMLWEEKKSVDLLSPDADIHLFHLTIFFLSAQYVLLMFLRDRYR